MSSNNYAIRVTDISKFYEVYASPRDRLKQFFLPTLRKVFRQSGKNYYKEYWALKDVSFEIKKGETVGIIGRNGAGKSTLLQIICGTLHPSQGSIETNGRIAALLELGSGFNPEFSGRENVFLNAAVLGLSRKEAEARFDDIVAFSEISDFIDQPVKTYSSGMYVRLAFSVIAHVDADILIVDEALAVGDVFFQQKCMRFLRAHQEKGGTVVFVSHDTSAVVNLCERGVLLTKNGPPIVDVTDVICRTYIEDLYAEKDTQNIVNDDDADHLVFHSSDGRAEQYSASELPGNVIKASPFRDQAESFGNEGITIVNAWFENEVGDRVSTLVGGESVRFTLLAQAAKYIKNPAFGIMVKDRLGQYVFAEGTDLAFRHSGLSIRPMEEVRVSFSFRMPILIQGDYSINIAVADGVGDEHVQHHWLNDAMALHSLSSRLVHGICGLQDLNMNIVISSIAGAELN
ncbi:ABC transporter ATP-binding protein [Pseudomonas fluorescens]|uniref:Vitamin B12 import ATP-binding protein BtuD n=1 Tax=Pseudomonas fluorescens TaxID=294 RepID=A0A5E7RL22_PSEFL|nr:ABC transporter ATP-binding protein [Pseudomonas fluorescens]VVP74809.1 Vitamin B12 import ATP-binding protein BtuD [Pseudomonas fluorescens]